MRSSKRMLVVGGAVGIHAVGEIWQTFALRKSKEVMLRFRIVSLTGPQRRDIGWAIRDWIDKHELKGGNHE